MGYSWRSRPYIPEYAPDRMPHFNRGTYYAVQRVLQTIWFGGNSPVDEAITWTVVEKGEQPDRQSVEEKLIEFINLVLHKIPSLQKIDSVSLHTSYRAQQISAWITKALPEIEELRKEATPIENEVWTLRERVRELRKRYDYLRNQEKTLQRKIAEMEERELEVQKRLEQVSRLSPVEVEKCLAMARSLADQTREEGAAKEKESI